MRIGSLSSTVAVISSLRYPPGISYVGCKMSPMSGGELLSFFGVAAVLVITPGADMALVTRNAIRGGRRAAFETTAGIMLGLSVWVTLSALGVAALLTASATAFTVLKVAGAIYLGFLGVQALRAAVRGETMDSD